MHAERNLLFGVFAVQLNKVKPSQIMAAAGAWAADQSTPLPELLVENGVLTEGDRALIQGLVDQAINDHGGDESATLRSFGGEVQAERSFGGSISITPDGVTVLKPMRGRSSAADSTTMPAVTETPGRYSSIGEQGRGGMGRVLLVRDEVLGRDIAFKELLPGPGSEDDTRAMGISAMNTSLKYTSRFLQEARITGQLEHPSIVPVYELGSREDGTPYYTMKLVRGKTLSDAIREQATLEGRLKYLPNFGALCQAIAYAHSRSVVHRDIKPQNVMVGEFGETVVLDWGLAKVKGAEDAHAAGFEKTMRRVNLGGDDASTRTEYGELLGTPVYAPPEQLSGQIDAIDERSDVYSLGAVLYVLLTGKPPYENASIKSINEGKPKPITELAPDAPPELVAVCERAMSKRPEDRIQSAKALADEIERFQSGALVQTYAYRPVELIRRFVVRHRAVMAVGTVAAMILISLAVWSYTSVVLKNRLISDQNALLTEKNQEIIEEQEARIQEAVAADQARRRADQETQARIVADRRSYFAAMASVQGYLEEGRLDLANDILMDRQTDFRSWEWGRLLHLSNSHLVALHGVQNQSSAMAFRPDSSLLVYGDMSGEVRVWSARSWNLDTVIPAQSTSNRRTITEIDFTRDGTLFATASHDEAVRVWRLGETEPERVLDHEEYVSGIAFHPDGRRLASGTNDGDVRIWRIDASESPTVLEAHDDAVLDVAYNDDGSILATASNDGTVRLWDGATLESMGIRHQHEGTVYDVSFSSNGRYLASGGADGKVLVSETSSDRPPQEWSHPRRVSSIAFRPSAPELLVACDDLFVRTYDCRTGQLLRKVASFRRGVAFVAVSPDDRYVAVAAGDGAVRIWPSSGPSEFEEVCRHIAPVKALAVSNEKGFVATAGTEPVIQLARQSGTESPTLLTGHLGPIQSLEFVEAGARLVSASLDGTVRTWDTAASAEMDVLDTGEVLLDHAAVMHDGSHVGIASRSGSVTIWDLRSRRRVQRLEDHSAIAFLPGRASFVAIPSDSSVVNVYEIGSDAPTHALERHPNPVTSVAADVRGQWIATGDEQGEVWIWDANTFEPLRELSIHRGVVQSLAFTPDSRRLLSVGSGGHGLLWDTETGEFVHSVRLPPYDRIKTQFGAGNEVLYVSSADGEVNALRALPFDISDDTSADDAEWAAAIDAWKTQAFVDRQQSLEKPVPFELDQPLRVLVSEKDFRRMLRRVATAVKLYGVPFSAEGGLPVTSHPQFEFLRAYELQPGDLVKSIGGLVLDAEDTELVERLQNLAKQQFNGVRIHLRRGPHTITYEYVATSPGL